MASKLQEEVTCPICMDILKEPVTIDCGHNFCLGCINQVQEVSAQLILCPLCNASVNRRIFRPNKLLAYLVAKIQAMEAEEAELKCHRHREKLHYFCEEDQGFLCLVCRESKGHKSHSVSLIEEAAQTYQGKIQSQVDILEQKEKEMLEETSQGESMIRVFRTRVHLERIKILDEFKLLRQSLEKKEKFLLARLGWLEQEGAKLMKRFVSVTQEQLSSLRKLIESLKAKQQMPARQLLQDIDITVSRNEGFQFANPTPVPRNLAKYIREAKSRHVSFLESLKGFRDKLQAHGEEEKSRFLDSLKNEDRESWCLFEKSNAELPTSDVSVGTAAPSALQGRRASYSDVSGDGDHHDPAKSPDDIRVTLAPVTLDASSAHPDLTLSPDLKTVRLNERMVHSEDLSRNVDPQCFYNTFSVLGSPGISSGCRIWEVELQRRMMLFLHPQKTYCIGVASEFVSRQCPLEVKPLNGFWALKIYRGGCKPLTDSRTQENLRTYVEKVGIYVDYDSGEVVFYDTTTNEHIYTFHASFTGKIFPYFQLLSTRTQITLIP